MGLWNSISIPVWPALRSAKSFTALKARLTVVSPLVLRARPKNLATIVWSARIPSAVVRSISSIPLLSNDLVPSRSFYAVRRIPRVLSASRPELSSVSLRLECSCSILPGLEYGETVDSDVSLRRQRHTGLVLCLYMYVHLVPCPLVPFPCPVR